MIDTTSLRRSSSVAAFAATIAVSFGLNACGGRQGVMPVEVPALGASLQRTTQSPPCPLFGPDGYYVESVKLARVHPNSRQYIKSMMAAGNNAGFWIAGHPVEYINFADDKTKMYVVHPIVSYHTFTRRYPWAANFRIEKVRNNDNHALVLQRRSCMIYELYRANFSGNVLSAYSGAAWSLKKRFDPLPPNTSSAMSSGLSLYAGMIRWDEVAAGSINHALNWAAPAGTTSQWGYVRPASDAAGIPYNGSSYYHLPFGARLRLRASFNTSKFGPQSRAIAEAMKTYGIYLADTGITNELYNSIAFDGSSHWNAADLAALEKIHISDFEVLNFGPVLQAAE
jgi:hypothetical protein